MTLTCFTSYDIRGRLGTDLDAAIAFRIGRGFARALRAGTVVVARDCRASSAELAQAVTQALLAEGVKVLDLGLAGTEEMYHATSHFGADGGIVVTASHNPIDYNGMKMVRKGSAPLDGATGLSVIRTLAEADDFGPAKSGGQRVDVAGDARAAYVATVLSFVDVSQATYISAMLGVYELNRTELLRDVFVWAYKRSCARYSAVRQSLGEPDPFRMQYREQITQAVAEVVRKKMSKPQAVSHLQGFASQRVKAADRKRFIEVVENQLLSLHEGNMARYRLRSGEFGRWRETWH